MDFHWNREIPTNASAVAGRVFTAPRASPATHVQNAQETRLLNRVCAQSAGEGYVWCSVPPSSVELAVIPVPCFAEKV